MDWTELLEAATEARKRAYCPYSNFPVGAAVRTRGGSILIGCNIENRTFGLTVCAERVAVHSAVALGHREVVAVAVVTDTHPPSAPCGQCREVLTEFARPDLPLLLANLQGDQVEYRLADLLPHPFELPAKG
ncbi:MAG: cytidine deaminase [Thermoanaerobaculia bacterium]